MNNTCDYKITYSRRKIRDVATKPTKLTQTNKNRQFKFYGKKFKNSITNTLKKKVRPGLNPQEKSRMCNSERTTSGMQVFQLSHDTKDMRFLITPITKPSAIKNELGVF